LLFVYKYTQGNIALEIRDLGEIAYNFARSSRIRLKLTSYSKRRYGFLVNVQGIKAAREGRFPLSPLDCFYLVTKGFYSSEDVLPLALEYYHSLHYRPV
jgi:hypothetical protein